MCPISLISLGIFLWIFSILTELFPWIFLFLDKLFVWIISFSYLCSVKIMLQMYYERIIDQYLSEWATRATHKPVLLRGARQVGKSTAVRHLGEQFKYFVEINLEKQQDYQALFQKDLDVKRIVQVRVRHILQTRIPYQI